MPNTPLDFQSMIFALQTYWAGQGCLISEPYYSQVGAGTMNPATYLRVLGPEPWKVGYVEPSVRPDDGRYGINPNRLQQHHQFQVVLKPDPGNPQELYLKSLEAIGIHPHEHDIRFVEDNWESPALSAWGLGWEVWLDGQEITQFTYFQQAGGIVLEVPAVEITYGLERVAMTLQRVNHFTKIRWNGERTFGDLFQVAEREHSTYYYEVADVERMHAMFDMLTQEANLALEKKLVLPAYDNVIKSSHTFNILDARGAVGFTERQGLFGRMRDLSRRVAEAYLQQREEMDYPWMSSEQPSLAFDTPALPIVSEARADLLLEIGTEELPVDDLSDALTQLRVSLSKLLEEFRLSYSNLNVQGTPRRLTALVNGLATGQADRVVEVKGPPADRAFDAEGKPTKVAEGFARSRNLAVEDLKVKDKYVVVELTEAGKTTMALLAEALPGLYAGIKFNKAMRWNASGVSFSRPVRWLTALLGSEVIPFNFAGVQSGRTTRGMRFTAEPERKLRSTGDYLPYLADQGILLHQTERRELIWRKSLELAEKVGGTLAEDPALLEEVTNLVEKPLPLLASFDPRYLDSLPSEVLIGVMKKHQRYFPVLTVDGKLTNYFILVRNGDGQGNDLVVDGNLQVVLARFADAEFFVKSDRTHKLEEFIPKLSQLTFQKQLGSMFDKTQRIVTMTGKIGEKLGLSLAEQTIAERVAQLAKADLATEMVVEMTALQGVIGRYYASLSGETPEVAQAIFEHYLPRTTEDGLPESKSALTVGIADRLDSIAGLFAVGLAPTGSKDPFALRRTALGLCQLLIGKGVDFNLKRGLELAGAYLPVPFPEEKLQACLDFIAGRLKGLLLDRGFRFDVVDAVLKTQSGNPSRAAEYAKVLTEWVAQENWNEILPAYSRTVRITRDLKEKFVVNPDLFKEPEELALLKAVEESEQRLVSEGTLDAVLTEVQGLVSTINGFFDKVLVMAEDPALRQSRLGLLQRIAGLVSPYVDLSALEGF
ncbi:MAG: glycine--tRNA ligase subunit beta [Anaerolineaceae bacterium]